MRKYRQISYYTFTGIKKYIELGYSAYGEWVVYDDMIPKYHINLFNKHSNSDSFILKLLDTKTESMESIINMINQKQGTKLSISKRPYIELIKKSELIDLELLALPEVWVKNL